MIKLSENRTALLNLNITIKAIENFDNLIQKYVDFAGPVCIKINNSGSDHNVQFDSDILVAALQDQRARLVEYMASLGIDANQ